MICSAMKSIGIYIISIIIICITLVAPLKYGEIDSYILPVESLEYRQSIIVTQEDIDRAKIDFPSWYSNIDSYDDLRGVKLIKIDDNNWLSYYFPIYAVVCMPAKVFLQLLNIDQTRAFSLTAALLLISLMFYVVKKCERDKSSIFFVCLLLSSPIWLYLNYVAVEAIAFSVIAYVMLLWHNKHYKYALLLNSIIATTNPTMMGFGIFIVADYVFYIIKNKEDILKKNKVWEGIKIVLCGIPSLCPFIATLFFLHTWSTNQLVLDNIYDSVLERWLAYFFDLNFGIASFATVQVMLFIIAFFYSCWYRDREIIFKILGVCMTVFSYSLHYHINCGMLDCARYVLWTYPGVAIVLMECYAKISFRYNILPKMVASLTVMWSVVILFYNGSYDYLDMNKLSQALLNRWPQIYVNFCDSTFTSRVNHNDGGYNIQSFAIYKDGVSGEVRKIQYRNNAEIKEVLNKLLIPKNKTDIDFIIKQMPPDDNKVHYINIPRSNQQQYAVPYDDERKLYRPGDVILCFADGYINAPEYNADKFGVKGLSGPNHKFSWTQGNKVSMKVCLAGMEENQQFECEIEIVNVVNNYQRIETVVNGESVDKKSLNENGTYTFLGKSGKYGNVDIEILLPDAMRLTDKNVPENVLLALGIKTIKIHPVI